MENMKLDISFPDVGCHTLNKVGDELHTLSEKPTATEVAAGARDEEWKGYVLPIWGGNNKQGVLTHSRVGAPKSYQNSAALQSLKENDVCQYGFTKPLKTVRGPGPKHLRLSSSLFHVSCTAHLDKQRTKKNEEAAECAKLLAKRMKETEEKHRNRLPGD
ncbi:hypothetical protein U0070_010135, partial [Myodes glareolus]